MKKILFILCLIGGLLGTTKMYAQMQNWRALPQDNAHLISAHIGGDYSFYYGLSYAHVFQSAPFPFLVQGSFSPAVGGTLLDDWKTKVTGQTEIWHNDHFSWTVAPGLNVRRFNSEIAQLHSLGGEITTAFGVTKPSWSLMATAQYDKPFTTHLKHGLLREYYPAIQNGWVSRTGGNFKLGIQAQYSLNTWSGFLNVGKIYGQNFKDGPTLPFTFELGIQKAFLAR